MRRRNRCRAACLIGAGSIRFGGYAGPAIWVCICICVSVGIVAYGPAQSWRAETAWSSTNIRTQGR